MNLGNLGGQLPEQLSKYLSGINFPAEKEQVVRQAESNQADSGILDALKHLPPGVYNSIGDIAQRVGGEGLASTIKGLGGRH